MRGGPFREPTQRVRDRVLMEVAWKDSIYIGKIMYIFRLGWGTRIPSRDTFFFSWGALGRLFFRFFSLLGASWAPSSFEVAFGSDFWLFGVDFWRFWKCFGRVLRCFFNDFSQHHRK